MDGGWTKLVESEALIRGNTTTGEYWGVVYLGIYG